MPSCNQRADEIAQQCHPPPSPLGEGQGVRPDPLLSAEEGASLSSGSLRLYALPYGCVDLYAYDPLNRRCAVGIMVANEHRRQGHALAMLRQLQTLTATHYRLHSLYADIAATNTASIALFHKAGYSECGCFKEWLNIDGRYIDSIRMQLIL